MIDSALALVALGLQIHPVEARGKKPLTRWRDEATVDPDQVRRLWTRWPDANIGVATGPESGVWVLDVDGQAGELALEAFDLPDTWEARTGKGRHLWFRWPKGGGIRTSAGRLATGLDVRGDGGYVVAPPSIHPSGHAYAWKIAPEDMPEGPAEAPPDLLEAIRVARAASKPTVSPIQHPGRYARAILDRGVQEIAEAGEGQRNAALNAVAYALAPHVRAGVIDASEVRAELEGAALDAGLGQAEIDATIRSGLGAVGSVQVAGRIEQGRVIDVSPTPTITICAELAETLGHVWTAAAALGPEDRLYRLASGGVAHVSDGRAIELRGPSVGPWLSRRCRIRRRKADGSDVAASIPGELRAQILADHDAIAQLPPLRGIVESPTFAGPRLLFDEGYDEPSGLYLAPPPGIRSVPEAPTEAQIEHATRVYRACLEHFAWSDGSGLANTVGAFLLPLVRGLFDGPSPAPCFSADAPGAGKTTLAASLAYVATGSDGVMPVPANPDELEKRITSELISNPRVVLVLDNLRGRLASGALEALITSTTWNGRVLGRSERVSVEHQAVIVLTGNDVSMSGDLARRTIPITLQRRDSPPPFSLLSVVRSQRLELLWSGLVLARGWLAAGRPKAGGPVLESFEGASEVLGGILAWAGFSGWLANRSEAMAAATEVDLDPAVEEVVSDLESRGTVSASVGHVIEEARRRAAPMGGMSSEMEKRARSDLPGALRSRGWTRSGSRRAHHPYTGKQCVGRFWIFDPA